MESIDNAQIFTPWDFEQLLLDWKPRKAEISAYRFQTLSPALRRPKNEEVTK